MPTRSARLCIKCQTIHTGKCPAAKSWERKPRSWSRGSTRAWRVARAAWLVEHPLCTCDGVDSGCPTCSPEQPCGMVATVVDHDDATDYETDRLDPSHFRSRCKPCHDRRTAQQGHATRRGNG